MYIGQYTVSGKKLLPSMKIHGKPLLILLAQTTHPLFLLVVQQNQ